jgi:hypothetical protein
MGKIIGFLTPEWAEKYAEAACAERPPLTHETKERALDTAFRVACKFAEPGTDLVALKEKMRREAEEAWRKEEKYNTHPAEQVKHLIARCIRVCECEYALGAAAGALRERCRATVAEALPHLEALRLRSNVDESDQRLHSWEKLDLWFIAALSNDEKLARSAATSMHEPVCSLGPRSDLGEAILHCALAGDSEGEVFLAKQLHPGYPVDFPPKLIEFPLGVVQRDPSLILEGVRKAGQKFRGKWDEKKHRAWYEKRQPRSPGRPHPNGTWEQLVERTKRDLFSLHWIFSWWSIAWLVIARQRGLTQVFEGKNRKLFSEWVPAELLD